MPYRFQLVDYFRFAFILLLGGVSIIVLSGRVVPFLNSLDLIFHEAGHVILFFLGEYAMILGGTIGQLTIPSMFAVYFLRENNFYAVSVMLWWFGENFINISVYAADVRAQTLPLLGGDSSIHDWNYLLGKVGLLEYDLLISWAFWLIGAVLMFAALTIAVLAIFRMSVDKSSTLY